MDDKTVNDLVYLDRLVKFYSKFLDNWKQAEVTSNGTVVRVKFFTVSKHGFESFTEREFPMEDIGKRISSYKRKIKKVILSFKKAIPPRLVILSCLTKRTKQ